MKLYVNLSLMFWKPPLYNSVKGVAAVAVLAVLLGNFVLSLYILCTGLACNEVKVLRNWRVTK